MGQEPLLDEATAAFVQGAVSVIVAARNAGNEPDLVRAMGARVDSTRSRVTLFLVASQATAVLADVRGNGALAAVFSQPSTHRTVQLKGIDARVDAVGPEERAGFAEYREGMVRELAVVGQPPEYTRALLTFAPADLVAVTFTPTSAYTQTPGPNAGAPLSAAR
jgi:hypothetical protein